MSDEKQRMKIEE